MVYIYGITIVKLFRISKIPKTWKHLRDWKSFLAQLVYIYGITSVRLFRTGEIRKELEHKYFNLDSN